MTEKQKDLLKQIISLVHSDSLDDEFHIIWDHNPATGQSANLVGSNSIKPGVTLPNVTESMIDALEREGFFSCKRNSQHPRSRPIYAVTGKAFTAVENDFNSPDTSFIEYLTPASGVDGFDEELKKRCLPLLATGGGNSELWDSVVRTAGVVLEDRLRDIGSISDRNQTGQGLVNLLFSKSGTLASKFTVDSERQGYRDLYSGVIGVFRNPSAHRLSTQHQKMEGHSWFLLTYF